MEVNFKARKVEPPVNRRGDIARTYFYMRDQYGLKISKKQQQLFNAWAVQDPTDQWEMERNRRISELQGNANAYVVPSKDSAIQITEEAVSDKPTLAQRIISVFKK